MQCCLWFRSVLRVRGPWPKRYGYHLSIIYIYIYIVKYSLMLLLETGGTCTGHPRSWCDISAKGNFL